MLRRSILTGGALLVSLVFIPATASSANFRLNPVAIGITHCNGAWSGKLQFTPALVTGGTAAQVEVSVTAVVAACTGGSPPPTSGKLIGKGVITGAGANNCANYFATPAPPGGTDPMTFSTPLQGDIVWTPTGIAPSTISVAAMSVTTTTNAAAVTFKAPVVTVTGSYPTTSGKFRFNTVKALSTILGTTTGNCGNTSGLSKLVIAGGGSSSKF